jgi:hypothetical protein
MIRIDLVAYIVLSWFLSGVALAGERDYNCTINHVYRLSETGSLDTFPESDSEKHIKQNPFSISRETGAIIGKSSNLDTSLAKSTLIIHRGSGENSFVAVANFGAFASGTHPYRVIKIEEYKKGSGKPFVAMGDMEIITGICK